MNVSVKASLMPDAPERELLAYSALAMAVSIAVDDLLPERMGFLSRVLVGVSVASLVMLLGEAVTAAKVNTMIAQRILEEVEALRAFKVTQAMEAQYQADETERGETE